jgi:hypothetical protein
VRVVSLLQWVAEWSTSDTSAAVKRASSSSRQEPRVRQSVQFGDLGVGAERQPPGQGLGGSPLVAQAIGNPEPHQTWCASLDPDLRRRATARRQIADPRRPPSVRGRHWTASPRDQGEAEDRVLVPSMLNDKELANRASLAGAPTRTELRSQHRRRGPDRGCWSLRQPVRIP